MSLIVEQLRVGGRKETPGKPIVDGISFHLEEHSLTLLIGPSGSGKTTVLRALAGLAELDAGRILYDGEPLWFNPGKVNRAVMMRHAVAFQFPEHQLFASSIGGEFSYSLKPYGYKRTERFQRSTEALRELQLANLSLEASPFALSGGQKRRLAVATTISARTPWLLLDEPSAGLDGPSLRQLKDRLVEWKQTRSIIMATHDWEAFLPIADRVLVIAQGRLLADLPPSALLDQPELLQRSGVGCPASLQAAYALQQAGISVESKLYSPEELAERIVLSCVNSHSAVPESAAGQEQAECHTGSRQDDPGWKDVQAGEPVSKLPAAPRHHDSDAGNKQAGSHGTQEICRAEELSERRWIYRQRAGLKWLSYTGLSVLILLLQGWWGTGIALLLAFGSFLLLEKQDALKGFRLSRPLIYFILITGAISGLQLTAGDWTSMLNVEDALLTIRRMTRFFAITLIGFVFTLSTSTAEMQRSLNRALSWGRRFLPVDMISLSAALILRFIPLIVDETQRFSVITAARGKKPVKPGKIRFQDVHVFVIPLLLSLFQMVEDLITAMEIKGYRHVQKGDRG
ncbi:ATP-binding cassette domain-containing protein [Xylanibacillus composti]|uniref:ATP-binding cassette domain-containing protein n=1 Tax=Xylanibacillus composti TaxID=1572762 RepID=A0A8J4H1V9_9BACL|nr:ATP-binding cassette domain-containing protein [Xylanibacillus composti]MDT9726809.1 ATP-binding cassette domain-containing protein [Xylanibacillus composti]GIQ67208.1 ATP-binding cassette domain-containing protein [Xylanibacillus composti]